MNSSAVFESFVLPFHVLDYYYQKNIHSVSVTSNQKCTEQRKNCVVQMTKMWIASSKIYGRIHSAEKHAWMAHVCKDVYPEQSSCHTVCHQHCVTAACHWTRWRGGWRLICLDSHERHPAPLWRFVILAPDLSWLTYLLNYCVCL